MLIFLFLGRFSIMAAEEDYMPLAQGMEWVMDFQVTSVDGRVSHGILHRKIGDKVQYKGKGYFRSHTWLEDQRPFKMDYTKLVRKDTNGFYSLDLRDKNPAEKQGGNAPLFVGKKWITKVDGADMQNMVLAKEDFTLGTNTYRNCLRVRINSPKNEYVEEYLLAPGIGGIQSEIKRGDGVWLMTLKEFKKP